MKINLEVIHSCTIKRKKPWPKISWIGKEKEQLFILDNQRMSIIDPKNGKTKRRVPKLKSYSKSIISFNVSDNGIFFVAILNTGDLIIWNKDSNIVKNVPGMSEFSLKLGFHCPSVFISNDMKKIILITSRNKIYVWESDRLAVFSKESLPNEPDQTSGNWSDIVASKDIKTVEDNKEHTLHVRFILNAIDGVAATCCFVFNYENKLFVNILKIKWINPNEIESTSQCRFETLWICHQPTFMKSTETFCTSDLSSTKFSCLYTRGAYVAKLSHNANILALACNQKHVEKNSLFFMSPSNGTLLQVNLRNFGLNANAKGRNYWIQDLCWLYNDLFLAGITKHGAIFLVSRLGHPLFIHAIGKEINMGPALFLTLHPLIVVRGNSTLISQNGDGSLSSNVENEDNLRQRYSLARHPSLPILVCSDGYLMCVFKIQTGFSSQSRLIRELVHETIGLLNSASEKLNNLNQNESFYLLNDPFMENDQKMNLKTLLKRKVSFSSNEENIPDWGLQTAYLLNQSDKSSDSGVDSNNEPKNRNRSDSLGNQKIAEGKIIFSFLPQIVPISLETLETSSIMSKLETSFEYLQSSWSLLISMGTSEAALDTHECDQTAKAIQQAFTHFSFLFLTIDSNSLKQFQFYKNEFPKMYGPRLEQEASSEQKSRLELKLEEEFKIKVLVDLFLRMLKLLNFDTASKHNPSSHMIIYLSRFVEKFIQSLLKFENVFVNESEYSISRMNLLGLVYTLLNFVEDMLKSIYKFKQNDKFVITIDTVICQKSQDESKVLTLSRPKPLVDQHDSEANKVSDSEKIETDSLEKSHSKSSETPKQNLVLVKPNRVQNFEFVELILQKCWNNLLHYAFKYRNTLEMLGSVRERQLNELDIFVILLERRLKKFPIANNMQTTKYFPIHKQSKLFRINEADLVYLDHGDVDTAVELWLAQLNSLFEDINKNSKQKKTPKLPCLIYESIKIAHKIFYACLANYKLSKLLGMINNLFMSEFSKFNSQDSNESNPFCRCNLSTNTFKCIQPGKPLQKVQIAIVMLVKSLARFMAFYLTDKNPLFICSVNNPIVMPSLFDTDTELYKNSIKIELSKERLTLSINNRINNLSGFFTADKATELFLITGLYDEAIYFLNLINDWKSSFLISSILKESQNIAKINSSNFLPVEAQSEHALVQKLSSLLGIEINQFQNPIKNNLDLFLMEKSYLDSVSLILKELLLCSVMTKSNVLENLLNNLMESLVFYVNQLNEMTGAIVPEEFYLPAPPIYCAQIQTGEKLANDEEVNSLNESKLRIKICVLCKCVIVLLTSSNLYVPLIKWYLEKLNEAHQDMRQIHGIQNLFQMNLSLKNLLSSVRYQKLGYIPESLFFLFRDFCAVLFFLDLRDRFSLSLRKYSKHLIKSQNLDYDQDELEKRRNSSGVLIEMSIEIIDYGNMMLSYRSFLKGQHTEIKDIVLSTISRLTKYSQYTELSDLNLEQKLAICVEKKIFNMIKSTESSEILDDENIEENIQFKNQNFQLKLAKLLEEWKKIEARSENAQETNSFISMADLFQYNVLTNQKGANTKLLSLYGVGEDTLQRVYIQKLARVEPSVCGGYDFERTYWLADNLEFLFKFGFDHTENWESIIQSVNQTPLLSEFYEVIRNQELANNEQIDKQYLVKIGEISKRAEFDESFMSSPMQHRKRRSTTRNSFSSNKVNQEFDSELQSDLAKTKSLSRKKGLFRSYSLKTLNSESSFINKNENDESLEIRNYQTEKNEISKLRKSVSFSNLKETDSNLDYEVQSVNSENRNTNLLDPLEQPLKVLDYGSKYTQTSNLAIWLIKWSTRFQKVLMANSKMAASFWHNNKTDQESKITLKLNSLTANLLVGCVYIADGNDLDTSSQLEFVLKAPKKDLSKDRSLRLDVDEEFTQVSSSTVSPPAKNMRHKNSDQRYLMLKKFNNNEDSSESTTLDISSFTENQIKNYFKKPEQPKVENKSKKSKENSFSTMPPPCRAMSPIKSIRSILNKTKEDSSLQDMSCTLELTEYYDLKNVKKIQPDIEAPSQAESHDQTESQTLTEADKSKSRRSVRLGSFEFLTNMFKSKKDNSRSPSGSKSPTKPLRKETPSPNKKIDDKELENNSAFTFPAPQTDVHQIIREELKKIVQIQHNTVMNFLNNGSASSYSAQPMNNNNIDQQIVSVLKQQQLQQNPNAPPVEFIIETKIKTVDSLTGHSRNVSSSNQQFYSSVETKENYFMKTFDKNSSNAQRHQTHQSKKSSFIKIPLLNSNYSSSTSSNPESNSIRHSFNLPLVDNERFAKVKSNKAASEQEFPLLDFKTDKHEMRNLEINKKVGKKVRISNESNESVNKHVKQFIQLTSQTSSLKNFPLLKLNFDEAEEVHNRKEIEKLEKSFSTESSIKSTEKIQRSVQTSFISSSASSSSKKNEIYVKKQSKETQVQKPMYDGYIIAPGAFDELLNEENEKQSATSALAHYNSTQHLRDVDENQRRLSNANRRDTFTTTDALSNANPIAPHILFKLQFDSSRKDRQVNDVNSELIKDFVNVADLDSNSVEDILKIIENEQNKRKGKYVQISDKKRVVKDLPEKETSFCEEQVDDIAQNDLTVNNEQAPRKDSLTEKLLLNFTKTEEEWKEYDEVMHRQIEQSNKQAETSVSKQRMANELRYIDEKIKLMNQMASEMSNDYTKYNKIVEKIEDFGKQREMIEKYQKKEIIEEERFEVEKSRLAEDEVTFYEQKEARNQIDDLKNKVIKPNAKPRVTPKVVGIPKITPKPKPTKLRQKQESILNSLDDDLSDLKENEEARIKKLLKASQTSLNFTHDSKLDTANSVTNILRDVFEEFDVETVDDLNSDKLDEILDFSMSPTRKPKKEHVSLSKLKPSKSPVRSRKELTNVKPAKHLDKTFSKVNRKISPIVNIEKEMSDKREILQEKYSLRREEEAKNLLHDILIDNAQMSRMQKQSEARNMSPGSPLASRRNNKSKSPSTSYLRKPSPPPIVPPLSLHTSLAADLQTVEMSWENKKPSLMAQTITDLKKKEKLKQAETEQLLRDLENRATMVTNKGQDRRPPIKRIKPFTSVVRLQEPTKLREQPDHKPLTYTEQLMMHQETNIVQQTSSNNLKELYKVYGSRRVKGVYKNYTKDTPRKVKSYSERVRELKPAESQALTKKMSTTSTLTTPTIDLIKNKHLKHLLNQKTNGKHNLKSKSRVESINILNKNLNQQRRFAPYKTNTKDEEQEIEKIDELIKWSLDDNIKNILYNDKPSQKAKPKSSVMQKEDRRVTYKEMDQDTLADTDGDYMMEELLQDEKQNENAFKNILKDLADIEGDDYVGQVNLDDLKNISLSSESALSSFIDWDHVDQIIGNFK